MFIKQLFSKPNHWMIKNLICNSIFIDEPSPFKSVLNSFGLNYYGDDGFC